MLITCSLWDKLKYQEAVDIVGGLMEKKKPLETIAKALVQESISRGSEDNVSVLLVKLSWS